MKVDPQQLIDDGYIALRQVVPPEHVVGASIFVGVFFVARDAAAKMIKN